MTRVKRGVTSHARHKKVLKAAKGFYGRRSTCYRTARSAVEKSWQYQYRDRKNRKRNFRSLWIQRINAAVREHSESMTYATFINGLLKANIEVDRKMLSELAISNVDAFKVLVQKAESALAS
jgi:large subunit ribosomal protein L20